MKCVWSITLDHKDRRLKILFCGGLPPPIFGAAYGNKLLTDALREVYDLDIIRMVYNKSNSTLEKFSIGKVLSLLGDVMVLCWKLISKSYDVVIYTNASSRIAFIKDFIFLFIIKVIFRRKLVCWAHGNNGNGAINSSVLLDAMFTYIYKRVNYVVTVGDKLREFWFNYLPEANVKYIYVGPEKEYLLGEKEVEKRRDSVTVLFLSIMLREKGWTFLLEAAKRILAEHKNVYFRFCGPWADKADEDYFRNFVRLNKFENNIKYDGVKLGLDKEIAFREADIFVSPTYYRNETLCFVNIEAMKFKLPVISTKVGAIPEVVVDGETGFVVDVKNEVQIADKIEYFINNPDSMRRMGENGFDRFLKHFTKDRFIQQWTEFIEQTQN